MDGRRAKAVRKTGGLLLQNGLLQRRRSRPVPLPRQRLEPAEKMRFSRFPRVEQPSPPSARRIAAARRAVQAEQDRYPLFPQLVTHHTPEARLAAIDKHRVEWWQEQRDFRADRWRKARSSLRALPPGPRNGIIRYWQHGSLPGDPTYLLGLIHDHKARKRCFWHALAELRRLKLISAGLLPNPWKRSN